MRLITSDDTTFATRSDDKLRAISIAAAFTATSAVSALVLARFGERLLTSRVGQGLAAVAGAIVFTGVVLGTATVRAGGMVDPALLGENFTAAVPMGEVVVLTGFVFAFAVIMTAIELGLMDLEKRFADLEPRADSFRATQEELEREIGEAEAKAAEHERDATAAERYAIAFEDAYHVTHGKLASRERQITAETAAGMAFLRWLSALDTVDREAAISIVMDLVRTSENGGAA